MPLKNSLGRALIISVLLIQLALKARSASLTAGANLSADAGLPPSAPVLEHSLSANASKTEINNTGKRKDPAGSLLDDNKLGSLTECEHGTEDKLLCELYNYLMEAVFKHQAKDNGNEMLVGEDTLGQEQFCANMSTVLQASREKVKLSKGAERLEQSTICTHLCLVFDDDYSAHVKPICRVILGGIKKLLQPEPAADAGSTAVERPAAIVPPVLANEGEKIAQPNENIAKNESNNKKDIEGVKDDKSKVAITAKPELLKTTLQNVTANTSQKNAPISKTDEAGEGADLVPKLDETKARENEDSEKENNENIAKINGDSVANNMFEETPMGGGSTDDETMYEESAEDLTIDNNGQTAEAPKDIPLKEKLPQLQSEQEAADVSLNEVQREKFKEDPFFEESDSNFFAYFLITMFGCIACYVVYHNKSKLLALALEGRKSSSGRGGFTKGRKHTAAYRKLDSNLEEAITSNTAASTRSPSQIIY